MEKQLANVANDSNHRDTAQPYDEELATVPSVFLPVFFVNLSQANTLAASFAK
jgi:hypothetical protein